jgi:PIN domain nuclease of toxin-antitoxin system
MSVLLDTNVMIWLLDGAPMTRIARDAIESADRVFVSAASIWELSVKVAKGRLIVPADLPERVLDLGIRPMAVEWEHARLAGDLPTHHLDPFDRMLIAQATVEHLSIVTRDQKIARYPVPVIAA